jgi:hypothetical protein
MENPFNKNHNTAIAVTLAAGAVTASSLAWLYFTESGASTRQSIWHKVKDEAKNLAAGIISNKTGIHKQTLKKVADHVVK